MWLSHGKLHRFMLKERLLAWSAAYAADADILSMHRSQSGYLHNFCEDDCLSDATLLHCNTTVF